MSKATLSASIEQDIINEVETLRIKPEIDRNRSEMIEILLKEALSARKLKGGKKDKSR